MTIRELIEEHGGGVWKGRKAKAVIPGGISMGFIDCDAKLKGSDLTEYDIPLDFNGPGKVGCLGLGTAAVMVVDDQTSMVDVLHNICRFFSPRELRPVHAVPRRHRLDAEDHGPHPPRAGPLEDLDILLDVGDRIGIMPGTTICGLADGAAWPVKNAIRKFRAEFEAAIKSGAKSQYAKSLAWSVRTDSEGDRCEYVIAVLSARCDRLRKSSRDPGATKNSAQRPAPLRRRAGTSGGTIRQEDRPASDRERWGVRPPQGAGARPRAATGPADSPTAGGESPINRRWPTVGTRPDAQRMVAHETCGSSSRTSP